MSAANLGLRDDRRLRLIKAKSKPRPKANPPVEKPLLSRRWCIVLLGAMILFFSCLRFRLRDMPLERDEGEYAYQGQLMLQGIAPYKLAYNMKLPGTYAAYALTMAIFGESPAGIHLGLVLVNAANMILVFLIGKRLFSPLAGLAAAASFALLAGSESVLGLAAHATHFVVLAALAGILVLLKAMESQAMRLYFCSGLLMGLAFLMKQPGLLFGVFGAVYAIVNEWRGARNWRGLARRVLVYGAGAILPFALTCITLYSWGSLDKMWFWTFTYGRQYASVVKLSSGLQVLLTAGQSVLEPCLWIWILAGIGGAALAWDSRSWKHGIFMIGFLCFSCLSVCLGLYFRPHYFILLLPAVSLLVGVGVSSGTDELLRRVRRSDRNHDHNQWLAAIPALALLGAIAFSLANQKEVLFALDPLSASREVYGVNPFPEALTISEYLNRHAGHDARIAVVGSEPEIYFYSRRHSATGYIYTYPLVEAQRYAADMQKDMAREIEAARPEYLVFAKVNLSWLPSPGSSTFILDWFRKYAGANYEIVGIADETREGTRYAWGEDAKAYREQSENCVEVFRRKSP